MARDAVVDLPAVRPHQRQALMSFLVQIGALALLNQGHGEIPEEESAWASLLRGLTPDFLDDAPWMLVVADLSKPALLQPPVPEGTLSALKEVETTPDALDMLVTSKNHDLKVARMQEAAPEHWFFALLTLQTMEGFLGAGNYGVARMNGGFASRPMVGLAPGGGLGARMRRDILRLIETRDEIFRSFAYTRRNGKALLWLEPWDGKKQLKLMELDPWFIEICRRVRLVEIGGEIAARRGSSASARILVDKTAGGVTGDPWAPIDRRKSTPKVLTVDGAGFNYKRVVDLLDPARYEPAPLQKWRAGDGESGIFLQLTATVRGQGGTDGFHERRIAIPPGLLPFEAEAADPLAKLAQDRVRDVERAWSKCLKVALLTLFQNAPEKINFRHAASEARAEPFHLALDRAVDRVFFDFLFEELGAGNDEKKVEAARASWLAKLADFCREQLTVAEAATPRSLVRRYFTISAARAALEAGFTHQFAKGQ